LFNNCVRKTRQQDWKRIVETSRKSKGMIEIGLETSAAVKGIDSIIAPNITDLIHNLIVLTLPR